MRSCGKLGFINCEIHRVWESGDINTGFQQGVENGVDNLHLPKITALEKAVGNFRERLQSFFSRKSEAIFFSLDYWRILRNFPDEDSLKS